MAPVSPPTSSDEDSDVSAEDEMPAAAKRPVIEPSGGTAASDSVSITDIGSGEAKAVEEMKEEIVVASAGEMSAMLGEPPVLESEIMPAEEVVQSPGSNQEMIMTIKETGW